MASASLSRRAVRRLSFPQIGVSVVALIAFGEALFHYLRAIIGKPDVFIDTEVWMRVANAVHGGQTLYIGAAADNKPPLFEYLNVLVGTTDHYLLVFHILVGLANAIVAVLIYCWLAREGHAVAGVLAALLFVAALPQMLGTIINVRSFALVFIFGALLARGGARRGVLLAIAGLFSQFAVFGVPVLAYDGIRRTDRPRRWIARFVVAGLGTVAIAYLSLALVWGPDALVAGVQESILSAGDYAASTAAGNPWKEPVAWARQFANTAVDILYLLVPAAAMVIWTLRRGVGTDVAGFAVLFAVSFFLTFGVKLVPYYWMFPTAFLAPLAALFIVETARSEHRSIVADGGNR